MRASGTPAQVRDDVPMSLPDVLIALHRSPRLMRLHGRVRTSVDRQALIDRRGRGVAVIVTSDSPDELVVEPTDFEVWVDIGGHRGRIDTGDWRTVERDDELISYDPDRGAVTSERERSGGWPAALWHSRALMTCDFHEITAEAWRDRAAWRVTASPTTESFGTGFWFFGHSIEVVVDDDTGVVLEYVERTKDGRDIVTASWLEIEVDPAIDEDVFTDFLPPGTTVRSSAEVQLEMLAARGVDIEGVDPADAEAVKALMIRSMHDPQDLLDRISVDGDPPADPEAAEAEISHAFASFSDRAEGHLPNVAQSKGLAAALDEVAARFPELKVRLEVRQLRFLNDHEAATVVRVVHENGNVILPSLVQRAVIEDGRWKLARDSFERLIGIARVQVPPVSD